MKCRWIFLALVLFACDDYTECGVTDYSEEIYINFYNIETKAARTVKFETMDVIYPSGSTISFVDDVGGTGYIFPLDLSSSNTGFLFNTDSADYNLAIGYNTQIRIENPDCGPIFRVTAISAESVDTDLSVKFDSVVVKVIELSKNLAPHVEIYF